MSQLESLRKLLLKLLQHTDCEIHFLRGRHIARHNQGRPTFCCKRWMLAILCIADVRNWRLGSERRLAQKMHVSHILRDSLLTFKSSLALMPQTSLGKEGEAPHLRLDQSGPHFASASSRLDTGAGPIGASSLRAGIVLALTGSCNVFFVLKIQTRHTLGLRKMGVWCDSMFVVANLQ